MSDYVPLDFGPIRDTQTRQAVNGLQVQLTEYFKSIGYTPATPLPVIPPVDPLRNSVTPVPPPFNLKTFIPSN